MSVTINVNNLSLVCPLRMRFPEGHSFIRSGAGRSGAEATNEWLARFD